MHRFAAALVLTAALLPAPAALAQGGGGGAFGPLPPAAPVETPTPQDERPRIDDGKVSRSTLLAVGIGVIAVFAAIGIAITRDARRSLTEDDRAALDRAPGETPRNVPPQSRKKARQKAKAQRRARRHNR